ncbi:glycoside hydrolase family 43 protein [Aaosphaeria arxii CBS 175.79]|uniref:Glycoside hydrolase family 43 protein n=1 Tax=Aaosphaeria arxii CBS 175.79 TaxID=1450172 RepID=A0A6A5XKR8_9PLEO|nr:glycoside hydrolase family 43 protein [Aaosphaeria arxii CBS 175.79]KAF2013888.1 glycoside hydrolase family 43 protein [Aaosphaeria arxii CBS 175.79]
MQLPRAYNNHILNITDRSCADPYVLFHNGTYYMTFTADGNRVEVWSGESLFDFESKCTKTVIWRPPPDTEYTADVWAPEIHAIHGKWYVYFAAAHPAFGNRTHRMYVLEGPSASESPLDAAKWKFHSKLHGMRDDQWAIDGTAITLQGTMYFVYSGWPIGETLSASKQEIFIMKMESPTKVIAPPVRISSPDYQWEYSGKSGINEGPQFLSSPDGRWTGIAYSCAGSWTSEYKMNVLHFSGGNPLNADHWKKWSRPLLASNKNNTPPYGPGHGNFVLVNGQSTPEVWGCFHATDEKTGWEGRRARVMRVGWSDAGPYMGDGECGRCSGDVDHFLYGCREGCGCGEKKPEEGGGKPGKSVDHTGVGVDVVKSRIVGEAKGLFGKVERVFNK